jgi:cytolysin (calcineurin-like family phosphatase)
MNTFNYTPDSNKYHGRNQVHNIEEGEKVPSTTFPWHSMSYSYDLTSIHASVQHSFISQLLGSIYAKKREAVAI